MNTQFLTKPVVTFASKAVDQWLYSLLAAFISGGASAVTCGLTAMGFDPQKFNLTGVSGLWHILGLMAANFLVSGLFGVALYLRKAPLPKQNQNSP